MRETMFYHISKHDYLISDSKKKEEEEKHGAVSEPPEILEKFKCRTHNAFPKMYLTLTKSSILTCCNTSQQGG